MKTRNLLVSFIIVCFSVNSVFADSVVGTSINAGGEKIKMDEETGKSSKKQRVNSVERIIVQNDEESVNQDDELPEIRKNLQRRSSSLQIQILQMNASSRPNSLAPGGGIHLGYQISDVFYIGLTSVGFVGNSNAMDENAQYAYDDSDSEVYGQDDIDKTVSELSPRHLLELRIMPWDFGLYFTIGGLYHGKDTTYTTFKSKERTIGDGTYTTSLRADVEYDEWIGAATGIGFNYIFSNGLSLGTGANIGLGMRTPEVTVTSGISVDQDDMDFWQSQIETNEKIIPYMLTLSIGYAF